jgi:hypothetical protein
MWKRGGPDGFPRFLFTVLLSGICGLTAQAAQEPRSGRFNHGGFQMAQLWGGRFTKQTDEAVKAFNDSI